MNSQTIGGLDYPAAYTEGSRVFNNMKWFIANDIEMLGCIPVDQIDESLNRFFKSLFQALIPGDISHLKQILDSELEPSLQSVVRPFLLNLTSLLSLNRNTYHFNTLIEKAQSHMMQELGVEINNTSGLDSTIVREKIESFFWIDVVESLEERKPIIEYLLSLLTRNKKPGDDEIIDSVLVCLIDLGVFTLEEGGKYKSGLENLSTVDQFLN